MSESADKDSKTEEATEKKIRDTVEKGKLPVSKEISIFASFTAILVFAVFFAREDIARLGVFLSIFLERPEEWPLATEQDAIALYRVLFFQVAKLLGTVMLLLVFAGFAASALQNVPQFVAERIRPQASRISPLKGWQRIFGRAGQVEFLKSLAKFLAASVIVFVVFFSGNSLFTDAVASDPSALPEFLRENMVRLLVANVLAITAIAGFDLAWSRIHWRQELRMTRQEVKDELKQSEGDPLVKSRLRSLGRDRARRRMINTVPTATLIVANPTHFSVALRYKPEQDAAPVVVAKGQDLIALKIREIAAQHSIPIFEDVPLARALYKQVNVDQMIAPEFYKAVAELIRVINARHALH